MKRKIIAKLQQNLHSGKCGTIYSLKKRLRIYSKIKKLKFIV